MSTAGQSGTPPAQAAPSGGASTMTAPTTSATGGSGASGGSAASAAGGSAAGASATAAVQSPYAAGASAGSPSAPPTAPTTATRPAHPTARPAPAPAGPRRVKLTVSRADPWSVMKLSFLISVAIGIAGVVMWAVLWLVLNGMGVFTQVNSVIDQLQSSSPTATRFDLMDYIGFGRVVSLAIVIGVVNVILLTALSTLGAFLYNVCSSLVGGLQVTLTDD